jgi:hypothetical protein
MNDDRLDLSPLDPTTDPVRYERAVGRIMGAAALPLARRRARLTAVGQVSRWWRPMLAVAAAIALAAVGVLTLVEPAAAESDLASGSVAEAMGIPSGVVSWMTSGEPPTAIEFFGGLEVEP